MAIETSDIIHACAFAQTGAGAAFQINRGFSAITPGAVGVCTLTLDENIGTGEAVIMINPQAGAFMLAAGLTAVDPAVITVQSFDAAGAPANSFFFITVLSMPVVS